MDSNFASKFRFSFFNFSPNRCNVLNLRKNELLSPSNMRSDVLLHKPTIFVICSMQTPWNKLKYQSFPQILINLGETLNVSVVPFIMCPFFNTLQL